MSRAAIRNAAVLVIGGGLLTLVLYNATNVDAQAPRVASYALTHHLGADDEVALTNSSIEIAFSEPVDQRSAEAAFALAPSVRGTFSWAGSTMSFTPVDGLPLETEFEARVGAGVRDRSGNRASTVAETFRFRTVGRPEVVASDPAPSGEVAGLSPVSVTFSTLMDTGSVERALEITPHLDHELRWSGETLSILPTAPLVHGERYELTVDTSATDISGNPLRETFVLRLTSAGDVLDVAWTLPADGVAGISTTTPIAVAFDEQIDPETLDDVFTIEPDVAGSLAVTDPEGAASYGRSPNASIVRFEPAAPLPANTTFSVSFAGALRAVDGSVLAAPLAWTFTTGAPSASLQNQVVFLTDRAGVRNLWAMNVDGSNQRQLSAELSGVTAYAVSHDGRRFVTGDGQRLVEQAADSTERRVLTDEGLIEFDPAYRADGGDLVFARADAESGEPLGIWTSDPGGGGDERVDLSDAAATPSKLGPTASERATEPRDPLLRAPRYSPDGRHLAYVEPGRAVVVVELSTGRSRRTALAALSAPVWRPDSSAVVVAASDPAARPPVGQRRPVEPLHAGVADVSPYDVRLEEIPARDGAAVAVLASRAAAPAVSGRGEIGYIRVQGSAGGEPAGTLWVGSATSAGWQRVAPPDELIATSLSFTGEPGSLTVARARRAASGELESDGIWRVPISGRAPVRLTTDGDTPLWLP